MNARQRFIDVLNFKLPSDRLPMVEWAAWWDVTIDRWIKEGLPADCDFRTQGGFARSQQHFGLDVLYCLSAGPIGNNCPRPESHGAGILKNEAEYEKLLPDLYPETAIDRLCQQAKDLKQDHARGDIIVRLWLDGFFWFPRSLFGIEDHFYAFYDQPELMQRMNHDLIEHHKRTLDRLLDILVPDMVGFAEDMSYNHGAMLSEDLFAQFVAPCYRTLVPQLKAAGMKVFVDSDGLVDELLPWLVDCGIEGIYPLERQSGVDVAAIREHYPEFLMLGGYNKLVMNQGEAAIRQEFERLLPVMRQGGFIPSVDHQTPPGVSLADYETYIRLFAEYARKAVSR